MRTTIFSSTQKYYSKNENCTNIEQINLSTVAGYMTRGPAVFMGRCQSENQYSLTSPNSTSTASNDRPLTQTVQSLMCECPRVALPHNPDPPEHVHVPAKHGLPVDSGGYAGGDCGLNGGDAYGTMSDSLSSNPQKSLII